MDQAEFCLVSLEGEKVYKARMIEMRSHGVTLDMTRVAVSRPWHFDAMPPPARVFVPMRRIFLIQYIDADTYVTLGEEGVVATGSKATPEAMVMEG